MRVLIVDDQPDVTESICLFLNGLGHEAVGALSGVEAMDRFLPGRYDVVVIDVVMPGMNGLELIRRIRAVDPATRIVAMTGTRLDFSDVLGEVGIRFVHKPILSREDAADLVRSP